MEPYSRFFPSFSLSVCLPLSCLLSCKADWMCSGMPECEWVTMWVCAATQRTSWKRVLLDQITHPQRAHTSWNPFFVSYTLHLHFAKQISPLSVSPQHLFPLGTASVWLCQDTFLGFLPFTSLLPLAWKEFEHFLPLWLDIITLVVVLVYRSVKNNFISKDKLCIWFSAVVLHLFACGNTCTGGASWWQYPWWHSSDYSGSSWMSYSRKVTGDESLNWLEITHTTHRKNECWYLRSSCCLIGRYSD